MEPLSNTSLVEDPNSEIQSLSMLNDKETEDIQKDSSVLEFVIFQGKEYLGSNCFNNEKVTVGRNESSDLVLNGRNVSDIHAFFVLQDDSILVSDENLGSGIIVNGKFVSECTLKPNDQVDIGPFTLKIKIKKLSKTSEIDELANTSRVYKETEDKSKDDQISASTASDESAQDIPDLYRETENESEESLLENMDNTIDEEEVSESVSDISGAYKDIENESEESLFESMDNTIDEEEVSESVSDISGAYKDIENESEENLPENMPNIIEEEEVSEVKEINGADEAKRDNCIDDNRTFLLKENLRHFMQSEVYRINGKAVLEVIKCRGSRIIDICFLTSKKKYYSMNECGRFCLAENKDCETGYFYFNDRFIGKVQFNEHYSIDIKELCVPENLYGKRKKFYRRQIPTIGFVSLSDGYYEYYLGMTIPEPSPELFASTELKRFMKKIKHFFKM